MSSECVFCKIVAGQIPCYRVYEDPHTLAFLDIGPLAEGHLLIIPRTHSAMLADMDPDTMGHLARQFPRLARAVQQVTGAPAYNLLQNNGEIAGQAVHHVHFHIIPRQQGDGLGYRWPSSQYPPGRAEELQARVVESLRNL